MNMERLMLISGIVCGFGVSSLLAKPRIVCDQPTFDFGARDASEVVEHTFKLNNSGSMDLVISAIRPACGCTAANLTRQTIPPGESAELSTRLTLAGRSGELHKTILVESNDPANPALQLVLVGKTTEEFEIAPAVLTLRQSSLGQSPAGTVQVKSKEKPFRISQVIASDPSIRVRADPMPDGSSYQISATFEKTLSENPPSSQIIVHTDNSRMSPLIIQTTTILFKKILFAPDKILLKAGEENLKKQIILKSADGSPLEIVDIKKPDPQIKVDYSARQGIITLTLRGLKTKSDLNGQKFSLYFASGDSVDIPIMSQ
jgi:hypothetical protein